MVPLLYLPTACDAVNVRKLHCVLMNSRALVNINAPRKSKVALPHYGLATWQGVYVAKAAVSWRAPYAY
jgi:hypothetical protein